MITNNCFLDSRHAYLGYVDIRNFWLNNINITTIKPNVVFEAHFEPEDISKIYFIISQYLRCSNSFEHITDRTIRFPCTKFIPNKEGKLYHNVDEVTYVKDLKTRACLSGYATIRVYNPKKIQHNIDEATIAGISIIETHEQYNYLYSLHDIPI